MLKTGDFVGTAAERGGCSVFIVHARNAWLKGLSPKENREVPPLRHDLVHRLKRDLPALTVVVDGGITQPQQIGEQLALVDGVMVGREAYHHPWSMVSWDAQFLEADAPAATDRAEVELAMVAYMEREAVAHGTPWTHVARHMLGLWNGTPGARRWR
jgi:tRNA-dihydrouridine synthase A